MLKTEDDYVKEIEDGFDWPGIVADCRENVEDDLDAGCRVGRCYLGSMFALAPSGKYYTSWANANLTPCDRCQGVGQVRTNDTMTFEIVDCPACAAFGSVEAAEDDAWYSALDAVAERYGLSITSGDDPCDLFAVRDCDDRGKATSDDDLSSGEADYQNRR